MSTLASAVLREIIADETRRVASSGRLAPERFLARGRIEGAIHALLSAGSATREELAPIVIAFREAWGRDDVDFRSEGLIAGVATDVTKPDESFLEVLREIQHPRFDRIEGVGLLFESMLGSGVLLSVEFWNAFLVINVAWIRPLGSRLLPADRRIIRCTVTDDRSTDYRPNIRAWGGWWDGGQVVSLRHVVVPNVPREARLLMLSVMEHEEPVVTHEIQLG